MTFVSGGLGDGKTDMALLLMEYFYNWGYFKHIASNVTTKAETDMKYVCYYDRLEEWLRTPGSKAFLLDELGINLYRLNFMSALSRMLVKIMQLIRKFDCHFFACAPSADFVDKKFFGLMEVHIEKLSLKTAVITNRVTRKSYPVYQVPRTSIKFFSKDIGSFDLKDPDRDTSEDPSKLLDWDYAARLYVKHLSLRKGGAIMGLSHMGFKGKLAVASKQEKYRV